MKKKRKKKSGSYSLMGKTDNDQRITGIMIKL